MVRLLVHVEGQTEEQFVNELLRPHLYAHGFHRVGARLLGNSRQRTNRGGIGNWNVVKREILRHLAQDEGAIATTMVDYYALPAENWPGRAAAVTLPFEDKAPSVHAALFADMAVSLGGIYEARRFVPYVVMHEFEGLLFSDCSRFASGIGQPHLKEPFQQIRDGFETPEEINDSPITAPSKRIEALYAGYQKPFLGILAALEIGLPSIRLSCPLFHEWLQRLEAIGAAGI